jgi:hypothetical protein
VPESQSVAMVKWNGMECPHFASGPIASAANLVVSVSDWLEWNDSGAYLFAVSPK